MDGIYHSTLWHSWIFLTATTPLYLHQLMSILKMTVLAIPMLILLQHESLMPNMSKSTSMMLLLTNTTSRLISIETYSIYYPNTKKFDGSLGVYPHKKVCIDLKPGANLVHHCAYPVPHVHRQTFKNAQPHGLTWYPWTIQGLWMGIPCLHCT